MTTLNYHYSNVSIINIIINYTVIEQVSFIKNKQGVCSTHPHTFNFKISLVLVSPSRIDCFMVSTVKSAFS